jgi:hypothetical protein
LSRSNLDLIRLAVKRHLGIGSARVVKNLRIEATAVHAASDHLTIPIVAPPAPQSSRASNRLPEIARP